MTQSIQTEVPDSWIARFIGRVRGDPTADKAWRELKVAGLKEAALYLLWGYAAGANTEIEASRELTKDASRKMKAAIRADRIARSGSPKLASSPELFRQRADEARKSALDATWPSGSGTVGDELTLATPKSQEVSLSDVRRAMVKAAGDRSPVNFFYFLMLLQDYAAEHAVVLGNKRLVALAGCTGYQVDEGTLGRYLRSVPQSRRDAILRDATPSIPPPAPRSQEQ